VAAAANAEARQRTSARLHVIGGSGQADIGDKDVSVTLDERIHPHSPSPLGAELHKTAKRLASF
jgi:hypothetical protein